MWWTVGVAVAAGEVAGPRADAGMETAASGMTWATAAFAASRCASAADTVAATELTSVNRLMPVAWTSLSSVSRADWLPATAAALALAAGVPAVAWPNWFFRTTMTGRSTFRESCAASVGGRDPKAGGSVVATRGPGRGRDHGRGHAAEHGGCGGGHGKNGQELAFRHVSPSPRQRLCLAAARATLPEFAGTIVVRSC